MFEMEQVEKNMSDGVLADIGMAIAEERKRQGLTLYEVSRRLRIPKSNLIYIEAGDLEKLPAITYVIGYVRAYARLLGLDNDKFCADLKSNLASGENEPKLDFIESRFESRHSTGRVALAAVVASIVIYGGWYSLSLFPTSPTDSVEIASTEPVNSIIDTGETETDVPLVQAVQPEADIVTPEAPKVTDAFAVNRTPEAEIVIEATAHSWVEVTRADGTAVISRLMEVGDIYPVPDDEELYLTTGNAGGLALRIGEEDTIIPGASGEVLRDLPLSQDEISGRY
jgi:cytoskeleton protein RodZ